jgi:crotonobetainyl-CoA:carnitine CoA-transferase CaiB-like acyl-CoA transferase
MSTPDLPLTGVRVIEMTHMVMGPTCGMILAQLGAEVIKVEPSAGDKTRTLGGMGTAFFPLFNRGKRSVVLDFAKPEDRETKIFAMGNWKSRGLARMNCAASIRS